MSKARKDKKGRTLRKGEGQRNDGMYYYRYTNINGERETIYSWRLVATDAVPKDKKDNPPIREQEAQLAKDLADGMVTAKKKVTLNSMFKIHIKTHRLANSTKENYLYMWEKFVEHSSLGNMDVRDIKKSNVKIFYSDMSNDGLADGTIKMLHKMIHPALQIAVDDDIIRKNPAYGCCKDYTEVRNPKYALSEAEQRYFLSLFDKYKFRHRGKNKLLFRVMFGTACRIGEIVGLTWKNVDMKKRLITIDHEVLYRKKNGKVQFYAESGKTKSSHRTIPMTDDVYDCFVHLRENRFRNRSAVDVDGYTDFVFISQSGTPLYPANVNKTLARVVNRNNEDPDREMDLPHISNHILRHTSCTRMAEAEMDPRTIQFVMGHADMKMIQKTYDHVSIERAQQQMKKLDRQQAV
jgi:integrase